MDPILQAQHQIEQANQQLRRAVQEARSQGRTWADIGQVLGISRQAAFKRFGQVTNPAAGHIMTGVPMSLDKIQEITERVFDFIGQAAYDELEQLLHPEARTELPPTLIAETWAAVLAEIGEPESYEDTHVVYPAGERINDDAEILGTVVGVTTLRHEAGEMMGRVAVDEQLLVTGILLVPPGQQGLPF